VHRRRSRSPPVATLLINLGLIARLGQHDAPVRLVAGSVHACSWSVR